MNTPAQKLPPVIGISGSNADSASVRAMMTQVAATGATPLFLGNHLNRNADEDIQKIDALICMGNNADIDPAKYGAEKDPHTKSETDTQEGKARAEYEEQIMFKALAMKMPVLGVCGGMQRLNVLAGGTLHQHVPDLVGHEEHSQQDANIAPFIPVQPVFIASGTGLSHIASDISMLYTPGHGSDPSIVLENSMHHQAVAVVGSGLRACAFAEDKVKLKDGSTGQLIEAIEAAPGGVLDGQFVLGVQWHPEFGASQLGIKIAHQLTSAAQQFAQAGNRQHPMTEAINENVASALPVMKTQSKARTGSMTDLILSQRVASTTPAR